MRQTIIGILLFVFGPLAAIVLERFMSGAPEWLWRLIQCGCILAGAIIACLSDPIYSRLYGEKYNPAASTLIISLVAAFTFAGLWLSWVVPYRKAVPAESGLNFIEVKPVPDEFVLDFGNNQGRFRREVLRQGVPFERLTGIRFGGTIPINIYFDEKNIMKVDATVYDKNGQIGATIQNSNFTIRNVVWDRNWDAIAFELVDEKQIPLFQIERPKDNLIKLRGIFRTSEGSVLVVTDNEVRMNPSKPTVAPKALFRYPSAINLGNRAER